MSTHICPTCSQPCIYKQGIMCTINGCIKDGSNNDSGWEQALNLMKIFGMNDSKTNSDKK